MIVQGSRIFDSPDVNTTRWPFGGSQSGDEVELLA